jgi:hypothetical protein
MSDDNIVKKNPRGRPRKTPIEPIVPHEPKTRGRKKLDKTDEVPKEKRKRGRKTAIKYFSSSIRKQLPTLTTIVEDSANYILHLNINTNVTENEDNLILKCANESNETSNEVNYNYITDEIVLSEDMIKEKVQNLYDDRILKRKTQDNIIKTKLEEQDSDCEETIIETDVIESPLTIHKCGYERMLSSFCKEGKNYPNTTNIKCWWCVHEFDNVPLGMPVHYNGVTFKTRGVFCSFNCILADTKNVNYKKELISAMYYKLNGKILDKSVKPAPDRYLLKIFGGPLSISEFRDVDNVYKMVNYPMCVIRDFIENIDTTNLKQSNPSYLKNTGAIKLDLQLVENAQKRMNIIDSEKSKQTVHQYFA